MPEAAPQLCVTVTAPTMRELRDARDAASVADLVELRLDTVSDPDIAGALAGRRRPVIVTCRAAWEGGQFRGSEEERRRLLRSALDHGAEFVDVEWKADFTEILIATAGRRVVLSSHDFDGVPADLGARAAAMRATGAEVIKIAARTERLTDCLPLRDVGAALGNGQRAVLVGMGDAGLITRVCPTVFHSAWTYAGAIASVGQVSAATLLDLYRFRSISSRTRLFGIVGSPVGHSVSPAMHNAAFAAAGIDGLYLPLPAADADDFLAFAEAIGLEGASVTIPYKVALFERAARVDAETRQIGALNTLKRTPNGWEGRNTDRPGFMRPLESRGVQLRGARASILGAGGSARSVAMALASAGCKVTLHARDRQRALAIAGSLNGVAAEWPLASTAWDLLINCTPIGMHPRSDESPVSAELLNRGLVYDLVYNPRETRLLRDAARGRCDTIGGLEMLVAQAVEQFEWWTGVNPDEHVMTTAAEARLAEFKAS